MNYQTLSMQNMQKSNDFKYSISQIPHEIFMHGIPNILLVQDSGWCHADPSQLP